MLKCIAKLVSWKYNDVTILEFSSYTVVVSALLHFVNSRMALYEKFQLLQVYAMEHIIADLHLYMYNAVLYGLKIMTARTDTLVLQ